MGCLQSSDIELIEKLTESPFFCLENVKNASYLSSISKRFIKGRYSANEVLWDKGCINTTFNIIVRGEIRLQFKEDKQMVIISKTEGQCFGFHALRNTQNKIRRNNDINDGVMYSCVAVTDLTVYQLSSDNLQRYWHSNRLCYDKFIESAIIPISSYLQSINVFSSVTAHNAVLLAAMFRWKKINKNEILFREGTMGEEFYIVAKGCVAVVVTIAKSENYQMKLNDNKQTDIDNNNNDGNHANDSNEREFIVGGAQLSMLDPGKLQTIRDHPNKNNNDIELLQEQQSQSIESAKDDESEEKESDNTRIVYEFKSGDYFGEVSLVIRIPRTATIKAIENTTLLELRKSDFQKFIPHNNAIKVSLEKVAHERIAQSFRRYRIPLFNAVPLDMFHILSKLSQIKYYKYGEIICDPDSKERALYVIAHGNVGVYVTKQRVNDDNEQNDNNNDNNDNDKNNDNDNIDDIDNKQIEDIMDEAMLPPNTTISNSNTSENSPIPNSLYEKEKISQSGLLNHDGNRGHHKRMSEQLLTINAKPTRINTSNHKHNVSKSANNTPITPISCRKRAKHKRISQHLLSSNLHLVATMEQREKVNRELVRLSFLSAQATNNKKDATKYGKLQEQFKTVHGWRRKDIDNDDCIISSPLTEGAEHEEKEEKEEKEEEINNSSSSDSPQPSPSPIPSSIPSPYPSTPNKSGILQQNLTANTEESKGKIHPITPPPDTLMNVSLNRKKIENTALRQSISADMATNNTSNLNINIERDGLEMTLSAENSMEEIIKQSAPSHARYHTALGTPSPKPHENNENDENDDMSSRKSKSNSNKDEERRRKSENALFRMKITKPTNNYNIHTPMTTFGTNTKSNIYERNDKLVRVADLILPDENIDKLRDQSRRGSRLSNLSGWSGDRDDRDRNRAGSNWSVSKNGTVPTFGFDIDKHSNLLKTHLIKENMKIDPSDPTAFENLDYAKALSMRAWNGYNDHKRTFTPNLSTTNNMEPSHNLSQLTEMIRKQEKEHELKIDTNTNNNNNNNDENGGDALIQYQSSSEHKEDDKKDDNNNNNINNDNFEHQERNGMRLRDFKSPDGKITYTEIEVSVLATGNFFGETSLMEEEEDNDDEYEDLNTPNSTEDDNEDTKKYSFETEQTGAVSYNINNNNNNIINVGKTTLTTKPSNVLELITKASASNHLNNINNYSQSSMDEYNASSIKDRHHSIKRKKSRKKKIDVTNQDKTNSMSYRGSHTTFRCISNCVIYSITKESLDEFFRIVPSARRWFDIMLSKYNVSLDTVLHIPRAARYFTLFLESEYAEENIHYVLSVNEYKEAYYNTNNLNQLEMAKIICNNFISDQGKQQINVSYHQRKLILDRIKNNNIDYNMFDITQKAIYILLERDCFPRFKQSHFFHEFLNEAENLALLTKEQYEKELEKEENINKNIKKESQLFTKNGSKNQFKGQTLKYQYDPKKNKFDTITEDNDENDQFDNFNDDNILKQRAKTVI